MDNLWKTTDNTSGTYYINIFEIEREKFGSRFSEWNEYVNHHINQLEVNNSKSNQKAEKLLDNGHGLYKNGNYHGAMQKYNECLNYAECGTIWERLVTVMKLIPKKMRNHTLNIY